MAPASAGGIEWPDSPFWTFSLRLYGMEGVAAACLTLQDELHLDVNMVLLAAWAAVAGRPIDEAAASRLRALSEPYQARVMQPLREARRGLAVALAATPLAAMAADRRSQLKRLELDLEHLEQLALEAELPGNFEEGPDEGPGKATRKNGADARFREYLVRLYPDRRLPEQPLTAVTEAIAALAPS